MRLISLLLLISIISNCTIAQEHHNFYAAHQRYKEPALKDRRFKHEDIVPLIKKLGPPFIVEKVGASIEERDIYQVCIGNGDTRVLLWSQMHGDEPTATMAIMDLFNFFKARNDEFEPLRQQLLSELSIYFIPMLNPDGADRNQRRNALGIDLNRDAVQLQTPEAKILKSVRDKLDADWGFNLHDQNIYYSAGMNPKVATVSFLAPAYNYEKDINEVRGNAMRVIGVMNKVLQAYVPGQVAKYSDDFEPRAFGDNIQKWGTSTILIESGGLEGDPEKQEIRKLNFTALLAGLSAIANESYQDVPLSDYEKIPFNESNGFDDLIVRNMQIEKRGNWYTVDLGFRRNEVDINGNRNFYYRSSIRDMGDLSIYHAYDDIDAGGARASIGKMYPNTVSWSEAKKLDPVNLWEQGYTAIRISDFPQTKASLPLPFQILSSSQKPHSSVLPGLNPGLLLKENGKLRYVVANGFLFDMQENAEEIRRMWRSL